MSLTLVVWTAVSSLRRRGDRYAGLSQVDAERLVDVVDRVHCNRRGDGVSGDWEWRFILVFFSLLFLPLLFFGLRKSR